MAALRSGADYYPMRMLMTANGHKRISHLSVRQVSIRQFYGVHAMFLREGTRYETIYSDSCFCLAERMVLCADVVAQNKTKTLYQCLQPRSEGPVDGSGVGYRFESSATYKDRRAAEQRT